MPTKSADTSARAGDWIQARGVYGQAPRKGEIIEVLGGEGHEHYRVRWDERHESIVYPADGVIITPGPADAVAATASAGPTAPRCAAPTAAPRRGAR